MCPHTAYKLSGGLFIPPKSDKSPGESDALLTDWSRPRVTLCCSHQISVHPNISHRLVCSPNSLFWYNWCWANTRPPLSSNFYFTIIYGPWPLQLTFYGFMLQKYQISALFFTMQTVLQGHPLRFDQWMHIHTCCLGHLVCLWKQPLLSITFLTSHIGEPVFAHLRNIPAPLWAAPARLDPRRAGRGHLSANVQCLSRLLHRSSI